MNICLLGNNLTNLVLANILQRKNIKVDIIHNNPSSILKNSTRTIAISNGNYKFLTKNIEGLKNLGWPTEKIKIYSEKSISSELFEFKNKVSNNFYLIKYKDLFDKLKKNKYLKFVKLKSYNYETIKKKYDLIVNSEQKNLITKKYFQKKIEKNYKSIAYTAIIDHVKIKNKEAIQIFTNNGPLAFLPLSKNKTSIVFSNNSIKYLKKEELLTIIRKYNTKYQIKHISDVESFNIRFLLLRKYVYKNILSFGDLIHKVHPLAGQGFNMTLRDIKLLIQILEENISLGIVNGEVIAKNFQDRSKHINFFYGLGIDSINSFFKIDSKLKNSLSYPIFKLLKNNKLLNNYATFLTD